VLALVLVRVLGSPWRGLIWTPEHEHEYEYEYEIGPDLERSCLTDAPR